MRKLILFTLPLILLFLFSAQDASATHWMGADMTYRCVGHPDSNDYFITINAYRDCDGIAGANSATLNINSASCGINQNFNLPRVDNCPFPAFITDFTPPITCEATPVCSRFRDSSCCVSNAANCIPGVQLYQYADTIRMPAECNDWLLSWSNCARNGAAITNINGGCLYIEAEMNNLDFNCNSSPAFTNFPVPYICDGQPFNYNQGAFDLNGDSLSYSLIQPRTTGGAVITYQPGYTIDSFISTYDPIILDPVTGLLSFTPLGQQVAVSAVKVEQYVNGQYAGYVMRDIQIRVVDSSFCASLTNGKELNYSWIRPDSLTGGLFADSTTVLSCPGDSIYFTTMMTGDTLDAFTNFGLVFPTGTWDTTRISHDTILFEFQWVPDAFDTGVYVFTIEGINQTCPILQTQTFPHVIQVQSGTYAGLDRFYCTEGGPIQLQAIGGTSFNWVILPDGIGYFTPTADTNVIMSPDISNPIIIPPDQPPYYIDLEVTSNLTNCDNKDTVRVYRVPSFLDDVSASKDTICRFDTSTLYADVDDADSVLYAPYTYEWFELQTDGTLGPAISLDNDSIAAPNASPFNTTTYVVWVTSDTGCQIRDTITIIVEGVQPVVDSVWGYPVVCEGDSVQLEVITCFGSHTFDDFNGGIDLTQWSFNQGANASAICAPSPAGGQALWFDQAGNREIRTNTMDVTKGGTVDFWFVMATFGNGGCNNPDAGDDVLLEYSVNGAGGPWVNLATYLGQDANTQYANWQFFSIPIPAAAQTTNTMFRMRQIGFVFANGDMWAIDDFNIECCGPQCANYEWRWRPPHFVSDSTINDPWIHPDSTTDYILSITPTGTRCELLYPITVTVAPNFTYTLTQSIDSICKGYSVTFDWIPTDTTLGPYTIFYTGSGTLLTGDNDCVDAFNGSVVSGTGASLTITPCETTTYFFEAFSDAGCRKYDSITIVVIGEAPFIDSVVGYRTACIGESVELCIFTEINLGQDDFNSGVADPNLWANISNATLNNTCGTPDASPFALHFSGPFGQLREARTVPLDFSGGGCTIEYDIFIPNISTAGCENLDPGEEPLLEYSTDGGVTWTVIQTHLHNQYDPWTHMTITPPAGALTNSTIIRWRQQGNYGTNIDNWAIDNVDILCNGKNDSLEYEWTWNDTLVSDSVRAILFPPQDGYLVYTVAQLGDICPITDSVEITVAPIFNFSSSQTRDSICKGEALSLIINNLDSLEGPYDIVWTASGTQINLDSACLANSNGSVNTGTGATVVVSPCNTTYYFFEMTSAAGCRRYDTFFVYVAGEIPRIDSVLGDPFMCVGETVELSLKIAGVNLFDDFNNGTNPAIWGNLTNASSDDPCGTPDASANALHFTGPGNPTPREAQTVPLDLTGSCQICYDFFISQGFGTNCENLDPGEEPVLEYSTDGGATWTLIKIYPENAYSPWVYECVTLPAGAKTSSTILRWRQQGFYGFNIDNWAMDNLSINCSGQNDSLLEYVWCIDEGTPTGLDTCISYTGSGSVLLSPEDDVYWVYSVSQPGGFCTITDSVLVKVGAFFNHDLRQSHDTICRGNVVTITLDQLTDTLEGPWDIIWTSGGSGSQLFLDSACIHHNHGMVNTGTGAQFDVSPCTSTWYWFEIISANGCRIYDSLYIHVAGRVPLVDSVIGYPVVCEGEAISLSLQIQATTFFDDFESGTNSSLWANIQNASPGNPCGTPDASANALHFTGPFGQPREAQTVPLNLTGACSICYDFFISAGFGAGCENLDPGEEPLLEYSTDGGVTWTLIKIYPENAYDPWVFECITLPAAAQTSATILRWSQQGNYGTNIDNWAMDNVSINCAEASDSLLEYTWCVEGPLLDTCEMYTGSGTFVQTPPESDWFVYTVTQAGGLCPYMDSIFVTVVPDFTYALSTTDDTICKNETTTINLDLDTVSPNYLVIWSSSGITVGQNCSSVTNGSVQTGTGVTLDVSPCNTTTYYFTIFSDSGAGCRKQDSITIYVNGESPALEIEGYNILCDGDSLRLDLVTCIGNAIYDDFDAGFGPWWGVIDAGVTVGNPCASPSPQGGDYVSLHPTEELRSIPLDLTFGGTLEFYVEKGSGFTNFCGDPDFNENLDVEYSIDNGATWNNMQTFLETDGSLETWNFIQIPIPGAAQTTGTLIRFNVGGFFASTFDVWKLDEVVIDCCDPSCTNYDISWTPNYNIITDTTRSPIFHPDTTTLYTVTVSPFGTDCDNTDTITVVVAPDFTWTLGLSDDTICKFDTSILTVTVDSTISPTYTINWSSSSTFNSIGCDNEAVGSVVSGTGATLALTPCKTTTYYIEIISNLGCRKLDTITLHVAGQNPRVLSASADTICIGDTTIPRIELCGIDILTDDILDTTQYELVNNVFFGSGFCTPPPSGTAHITFNGTAPGNRTVRTTPMDLTNATTVSFWIIKGTGFGGTCGDPDFGEDLRLEYDNGIGFLPWPGGVGIFAENDLTLQNWTFITLTIPGNMRQPNVRFQWVMTGNFMTADDVFAIDDILIECCDTNGACAPFTYNWIGSTDVTDASVLRPGLYPDTTTRYTIEIGLQGTNCLETVDVDVAVAPEFTWTKSNDTTICRYDTVALFINPEVGTGSDPYEISWFPNNTLNTGSGTNVFAFPGDTTNYKVVMTSVGGCVKRDTITVNISGESPFILTDPDDTVACPGVPLALNADLGVRCGVNGHPPTFNFMFMTPNAGGTPNNASPFNDDSDYRIQMLFTAADLQARGLQAGYIDNMTVRFNGALVSTNPYTDFAVKMGCTNATSLATGFVGGTEIVYDSASYTPTIIGNDWTLLFENTYDWDGVSNLVLEVCYSNFGFPQPTGVTQMMTDPKAGTWIRWAEKPISPAGPWGCDMNNAIAGLVTVGTVGGQVAQVAFGGTRPNATPTALWTANQGSATIANPSLYSTNVTASQTTDFTITMDDNGCVSAETITVTVIDTTYNITPTDTTICAGEQVQIDVTGNGTITAVWSGPGVGFLDNPNSNNPVATPTATADYYVDVTVDGQCVFTDTITINVIPPETVTLSNLSPICGNGDMDTITASVTGVNPITAWSWSNGAVSSSLITDVTGNYWLDATVNGCVYRSDTVAVTLQVAPNDSVPVDTLYCPGEQVDLAPVSAAGTYANYEWSDGTNVLSNNHTYSFNAANTITLTLQAFDGTCWFFIDQVTVNVYVPQTPPIPFPAIDPIVACHTNPGVQINSQTGYVSYEWYEADGNGDPTGPALATTPNYTTPNNGTTTTYVYLATTSDGCVDQSETKTITYKQDLTLAPDFIDICVGESATLTGPAGYNSYVWKDLSGNTIQNGQTFNYTGGVSAQFTIDVTDADGCTYDSIKDYIVTATPPDQLMIDSDQFDYCDDDLVTFYVNSNNSHPGYRWMPFDTVTTGETLTIAADNDLFSFNNVKVDVSPASNCVIPDSMSINVYDYPIADIYGVNGGLQNDTTVFQNDIIDVVNIPANTSWDYSWSYLVSGAAISGNGPSITVTATTDTIIHLVVTEPNNTNCSATDDLLIEIEEIPEWVIPSVFTPNADGINDIFGPISAENPNVIKEELIETLIIFDRWGNEVFEGRAVGWDGMNLKSKEMPVGTYVYHIVINSFDADNASQEIQVIETGTITLVR